MHLTPITVGASDGQVSVVEQGLQPGARVVLEGTDSLRTGNKVEVIDDNAAKAATAAPAAEQPPRERQGAPRAQ